MYQKKEYKTLRMVSNLTIDFGWKIVGGLTFLGLAIGWSDGGFGQGILLGIILGVIVGIPFIISGQMVSVFLDQKELLEDILDSLSKSTKASESTSTDET